MKLQIVSTYDLKGGAGRAAYRLHCALRNSGVASQMLVLEKQSDDPDVHEHQRQPGFIARVRRNLIQRLMMRAARPYRHLGPDRLGAFAPEVTHYGSEIMRQLPDCDVVNLHWITWLADYRHVVRRLPQQKPVIWTLHDMTAFTGGCLYSRECRRFQSSCGCCPSLASDKEADWSRKIWSKKRQALEDVPIERLHIVTPSHWLANLARTSSLLGRFPVSVIPNGIDARLFLPGDKTSARSALGLPQDRFILLFVSEHLGNRYKGFDLLLQALAGLPPNQQPFLLAVGNYSTEEWSKPNINMKLLGSVADEATIKQAYVAADLMVIPSLEDNLPNVVLEAMSCGTPVLGFATGGIPDMIADGCSGLLIPKGDVKALAEAIHALVSNPDRCQAMGLAARQRVNERFTMEIQAASYRRLYEAMLDIAK